jgi:hypothetical protein
MIRWTKGSTRAPKDRRLLLIATPNPGDSLPREIVVGHWHEAREEFVAADLPSPGGRFRPDLTVEWWAEIPNLPQTIGVRALTDDDLWG